ncbi:hypothetical protein B0T11DRAFT_359708 [Plectosphaerella cucumerina]|uniref:NAD(P)-binding protein n=1 Tax=Plectosphaerella cucumerina TaxID=40658 RepID=A0A8K0T539_9PEZI|nr:hypothetical protein B0T11DRAFT_359708 [Plectosphaerella cucumerina]
MADWNAETDMSDLQGKVALVTGASYGIGFQIAKQLRQRGAKVFGTTRSEKNAQAAREKLRTGDGDLGPGTIEWVLLDLTDLKSITAAASTINKSAQRLDIMSKSKINNAAAITKGKQLTANQWEMNMAVNVIGPFLLINRLISLLESTAQLPGADVRVVNLSSTAPGVFLPANFQYSFDSPAGLASPVSTYPLAWRLGTKFIFSSDMILYSVSKAAVQLFASKLQRLFDARGLSILSLIVHPGEVSTEGLDVANGIFLRTVARLSFVSAEQGAASPLFAATAASVRKDLETYKHKLLMPVGKTSPLVAVAYDESQAQRLWDVMTEDLGRHLSAEGLPPMEKW